ncbi:nucleolar and coiled-body phosphoprotein 1 isoform X3 [Ictalurus punctatus]|uniref:Nucleolar and coiled-body phosphoprotein 1 isoform X3 n=1 Tax=Ictalurus punctatus TaxID=7998 RepID=A0A2D0PU66_ICTPU|nr:nucleolar and coiled-body phosphoprotein 1 isoform X3 [Ictalurus punctatus]
MDRKMMNLGRAKKKLRYFQSEESTPGQLKIKDVFSMQDLDNIFDDLDSDPGTPLLSPLPKSPRLDEQNKGSQSPVLKSPLPFKGQISPLKGSDVLAAEANIQTDHLNDKAGSPFEEIAPIKTSSPIELLAVEGFAEDAEKPETSPLLFVIEDEEPVVGDLSKPQMNQRSESPKGVPEGDSESLASPPARLEFGKPPKQNDSVTSSTPLKAPEAPDQVCDASAPEPEEESQTDGRLTLFPVVLIQKHLPEQLLEEQPNKQVQEVAVEVAVKQLLFQKKLKNSLQPKASCFRKQETVKQPVRAPSPHVQEEDFMILEDDSPIRFTIPRKTEIKAKPAPESGSAMPDLKEKASPKQTEEAENHKDEPKKKTKAKRGKASDMTTKDSTVQSAPEEREEEAHEDVGDGEQICLSPDTNQDADIPGKQRPKGITSNQHGSKDGNDGGGKIPAEKPAAKTKKSANLPTSTIAGQEEPASNVKKKPRKIKSAIKAGAPECTGLSSAKAKTPNEDRRTIMNKKRAKEQEHVDEVQNHTEPQLEVQSTSTSTVNKANKEPASKHRAPKKPLKVKKAEKTKEIFEVKELPVPESADVSASSRRKRKPPGEWWLTQHDENSMQEQQKAVQSAQELKSNRKTQRKAPVLTDSTEEEFVTTSRETRNEPVPVQKLPKKVKKSQTDKSVSNPAGSLKNPKSAGGRRKPKLGAQDHHEMTPALRVAEEARDNEASGQLSPEVACSRLHRQRSLTPGDKRVFDKIYTREDQSGSAQKRPPRLPNALESVPVKRQRKTPRNWWEVPQSQGPVESSRSPRNSSPQTSRPQMGPPQSAFRKMASLKKTVGRSRKITKTNNMVNTPKSVRKSLATFDALYDSGKLGPSTRRGQGPRQKGRRNLLHSLEEQSEQSSENIHNDYQQQQHATFDMCASGDVPESSAAWRKTNPRASSGSNRASADYDIAFKSGPSSLIELERYEEDEDIDMPSSRVIPQTRFTPRVLSECDLCGPPLKPIVLDNEDWDNLCIWFTHIWPTTSKDGKGISPDDFHWHCHAGRAMGHMVDIQNNTFSSGKILLGSYMKKPVQTDLNAITVFNVASSCVRVETDSAKEVYNSGQTFMTSCGQSYSIHNLCQEPAVLWYHRMLPDHTTN